MFCPTCNKELPDGAQFCTGCGAHLEATATSEPAPAPTEPEPSPAEAVPVEPVPAKIAAPQKTPLLAIVAACLAITCFFLPLVTISASGITLGEIRMLDLFMGIKMLRIPVIEPYPRAALFIALPAVAVLAGLLCRGRARSIIIELAGISLGILCFTLYNELPALLGDPTLSVGFYGYALCAAIIIFSI